MNPVVGIDLGTTFSAIAYVNECGKAEIIPNRDGERITPSVVLFEGDTPIVGTMAKSCAKSNARNVCQFVKRQMGDKEWRFITEVGREYTAEEISAIILRRLREDAQRKLGCEVTDAVITVPAYFNDPQRTATRDAGKIAGLNVFRIINEPTAAALAYGLENSRAQTIMVYDLGGGTFDVTIMRISQGVVDVIATGGDRHLGGFDWDNDIMVFLNEEFKKTGGKDLLDDIDLQHDLREKAEMAKKRLTDLERTAVPLAGSGRIVSVNITRDGFERITANLLKRTEALMELTLEDAKLRWSDIDKVLLVGGSTRMKAVPALIERVSGRRPSAELHPDEVVALGAALMGGLIRQRMELTCTSGGKSIQPGPAGGNLLPAVIVNDVTSHSLGVVVVDDERTRKLCNSIILPRQTKFGTKASKVYATLVDSQSEIEVEVTQGEEEDIEFVHVIGKGSVRIPPYPKGAPVEISFEYDNDGTVYVSVYDLTAKNRIGQLTIRRNANLSTEEVEELHGKIARLDVQ